MKNFFIIDGMGLIFRAYYAMIRTPLRTRIGKNTSAIHGFVRMLLRILTEYTPDELAVAWDVSRDTFRKELYSDYKANRLAAPDDLKEQIGEIIELVKLMGIPGFAVSGYEADDLIGTLADRFKKDHEVMIVSGDKDLFQLIDGNVKALGLIRGLSEVRILDSAGVKEVKGVFPEQIPDFLAIMGDSSDNIPGVKGIGEKGAVKLLDTYSNLEEIYEHLDEIKGATRRKLIESRKNAFLSKKLALICRDVEFDVDESALLTSPLDEIFNVQVIQRLEEFELSKLIEDIKVVSGQNGDKEKSENALNFPGSYKLVTTNQELQKLIYRIQTQKFCSLDFETDSLSAVDAHIIGIALSIKVGKGFYIPLLHEVDTEWEDENDVLELFRSIFENPNIAKWGQNLKYEAEVLLKYNIQLQGIDFDSMLAAFLVEPGRTYYNLDNLAQSYLNYQTIHYQDVVDTKKGETFLDVDIDKVTTYAGEDADIALRLREVLKPKIEELKLEDVFRNIELPLVRVLAIMENNGVQLDTKALTKMSEDLGERLEVLKEEIDQLAGESFNINSPKQLGKILFEKMKIPVVKKTKTGQPATNEEVLRELSYRYDLPKKVLEYRNYAKLKGTYVDTLPLLIHPSTGRIHTSYHQTGTQTGRLSSSDPNLQNIPIRDELGRKIRQAFVADVGKVFLSADYSQVELRLFAHFSKDPVMIKAFREGQDIHRSTAALILGIELSEVTDEDRRMAKVINYGISYGMSAFRLGRELGISIGQARDFINRYFEKLPGIPQFMQQTLEYAYKNGEVRTLFGRRRPASELYGKTFRKLSSLSHSERFAINSVVQGTAADIMKLAMIHIQTRIEREFPQTQMLLQIHDELVLEVEEDKAELVSQMVQEEMEGVTDLLIPLTVEVGIGKNWGEAH